MGIYMSSHAMIGVKFTPTSETKPITIRGCDHVKSNAKFCAECGKPMWKDDTETVHQFEIMYEEFTDPVLEELVDRFDGFAVVAEDYEGENIFIGYGTTVENHEQALIPRIDFDAVKIILREVLEPYGVWDQVEDSFGLWAVSTGS